MVLEIVHKDVFENFLLGHFCLMKTNVCLGVFNDAIEPASQAK